MQHKLDLGMSPHLLATSLKVRPPVLQKTLESQDWPEHILERPLRSCTCLNVSAQGSYGASGLCQLQNELWGREGCCPHQYSRLLGSTLAEVKHLPWVEIPHEGLDDLGSLGG